MQYYSQCGQDFYLDRNIFKGMTRGVFVDVGSHDGTYLSNSLFFEKTRDWSGLCIEADPKHQKALSERKCFIEPVAVADKTGTLDFYSNSGYTSGLSGLVDFYHPEHKKRLDSENSTFSSETVVIKVPVQTLQSVLDKYSMDYIHYLSIDTEGSELSILKSIDFEKTHIDVIGFEANYPKEKERCLSFLKDKGYEFLKDGLDVFVVHHDSVFRPSG